MKGGLWQKCCGPFLCMLQIKSPDIASNTEAFWKRAKDGTRTRDPNLGKVTLYQLSYFRDNGCKDIGIFLFSKTGRYFFYTIFSFPTRSISYLILIQ